MDKTELSPNALTRIRSQLPTLNESELRVAMYVLHTPDRVIYQSMAQVAQACSVSDTTVLRFARNVGFHGYTDLKLRLAQDLAHPGQIIHQDVLESDDAATIARKVFMSNIKAIQDTLDVMDMRVLNQAVNLLQKARRILIIGVGTSGPIVQEARNRFFRLGLNCHAYTDSYLQIMDTALVAPGDVVIAISQTGASTDPVTTLELAKKNGASTIVITGNAQSPLTEFADVTFLSVSLETHSETIASRIAQISIIDALYVILAMHNLEVAVRNERKIWQAILTKAI